ncbi:MAG TPA: enoyl-CoA hydratase/isomerase family protein [Candidatus Aquabacterium excrementipullorum]|nr:enoyl-CoA hydratase/isomerase family protein [Candidatus Aquabacterium excrementipullorum]
MREHQWENLSLSVDANGVALLTMDVKGRADNAFTPGFLADLAGAVAHVKDNADICGLVITSGKATGFCSGAAPEDLLAVHEAGLNAVQILAVLAPAQQTIRALEQCGKPVAAAIHGGALGGGYELALACHHRVIAESPRAVIGLPEVQFGVLPGGGGTQRLPRLIGIAAALPLLLSGRQVPPAEALQLGLVDQVLTAKDVIPAARRWVLAHADAVQPWDVKGFKVPGGAGALASHASNSFGLGVARVRRDTQDNEPAPLAILSCVYEGTQLPIDQALALEARHFSLLLAGPVARNRLRTLFVNGPRLTRQWAAATRYPADRCAGRLVRAHADEARALAADGVSPSLMRNAAVRAGFAPPPILDDLTHAASPRQPNLDDVKWRWLSATALEAARCLDEGVIDDPAQADVVAVRELGYPAWTGGPISFIETQGVQAFVAQCDRLSARSSSSGDRFCVPPWLRERATQAPHRLYPHPSLSQDNGHEDTRE